MSRRMYLRILSVVIIMSLFFSFLPACQTKKNTDNENTSTIQQKSETKPEPIDISIFVKEAAPEVKLLDTPIGKKVMQNCNVNLTMEYSVGDIETKIGIILASGDFPDVVQLNSPENMQKFIDQKVALPIGEYVKQSPNIMKALSIRNIYNILIKRHGDIYYIPFDLGGWAQDYPSQAFFVQKAVLKEFGWPKIKTIDELWDIIEKYKQKYPEINGAKTIGYTVLSKDWQFDSITNPEVFLNGYQNDGGWLVDKGSDGNYVANYHAGTQYEYDWLKMLNTAHNKGLFDKEGLVETEEQWKAKMSSGKVLATFAWGYLFYDINDALKSSNMSERAYVGLPIVKSEGIKERYMDQSFPELGYGLCITSSCKNPARVVKFFDDLLSEENSKLREWGEEGIDYTKGDDGKFFLTQEQIANLQDLNKSKQRGLGIGGGWVGLPGLSGDAVFSDGNVYGPKADPRFIQLNYDETDLEFLKAYGATTFTDFYNKPEAPYGYAWSISVPEGSNEQITRQKLDEIKRELIPAMILATTNNFESIWKKYTDELSKLDIKGLADYVSKQINKRVEEGKF